MTDRPILFSGPMVRALIEGRKIQTRRVLKPQPPAGYDLVGIYAPRLTAVFNPATSSHGGNPDQDLSISLRFMIRDLLWVRETGVELDRDHRHTSGRREYAYAAETMPGSDSDRVRVEYGYKWQPSIFMPRWASRLTLAVTAVRVEHLWDITEEDARAEGICSNRRDGEQWAWVPGTKITNATDCREAYLLLWEAINGAESAKANPWVVALTFTVHQTNIDSLIREPGSTHSQTPSHNQRSIAS